ncbi:MAG TPA: glutamate-5-semialdehyde dehydrogenase [Tepidisphaeraceae bacterium]|nr:glutamate-5-semialdehyde dehydrogenase [Tepidisphaeraceae bacterium]
MEDIQSYVHSLGQGAQRAARKLATVAGSVKTDALIQLAAAIRNGKETLLAANAADVAAAEQAGLARPLIERLKLNEKRMAAMAGGVEQIAGQVDPVGQIIEGYVRPTGLRIQKMRVPIGVVLFFYESRPNVTSDAAALCIKSGNAVILRGGKESLNSNLAIGKLISQSLAGSGLDPASVQMIESADRAIVPPLLKLNQFIDLVIPRGGESLIRAVTEQSTIPVLKHFTGNCHVYVDAATEKLEAMVRKVCVNAKTSYPGGAVCNAAEKILFHAEAAPRLLAKVCQDMAEQGVEIRGCPRTRALYPKAKAADESDWPLEYLALIVAVKVVDSLDAAISHINEYGSHHTDAILSDSAAAIEKFVAGVDSASVMVNASTRLADGGEYGLGAEIGISTDKLHARGPMGAGDLTTYKWVVTGQGHLR